MPYLITYLVSQDGIKELCDALVKDIPKFLLFKAGTTRARFVIVNHLHVSEREAELLRGIVKEVHP